MTVWRAGMAASCIDDRWHERKSFLCFRWVKRATGPRKRQTVRIAETWTHAGLLFLGLVGYPDCWFDARGFRPLIDDQSDADLVARIKQCRPAKAPTLAPKRHERAGFPRGSLTANGEGVSHDSALPDPQPLHDAGCGDADRYGFIAIHAGENA